MILLTSVIVILSITTHCASKKVNVLLVIIDDLKPNLGAYGYRNAFTPNIDALADRSFIFNAAFAQVACYFSMKLCSSIYLYVLISVAMLLFVFL